MNWDAIGAVAELIAAVATVATLAYLALQIRQSNKITRISIAVTRIDQKRKLTEFLAHTPEINRIFRAGIEEPESLSPADYRYFEAIFATVLVSFEAGFNLQQEDELFAAEWEGQVNGLGWLITNPSFDRYWSTWRFTYAPEFISFVDALVIQLKSD
jgi:hypothetical protein